MNQTIFWLTDLEQTLVLAKAAIPQFSTVLFLGTNIIDISAVFYMLLVLIMLIFMLVGLPPSLRFSCVYYVDYLFIFMTIAWN